MGEDAVAGGGRAGADPDAALLAALRAGDERALAELVGRYQRPLLRLAEVWVPSRAVAEEVVQEAWIAVLRGVARFEGRSTFRTWLFRIVRYQAQARGRRERRSLPLSALSADEPDDPAVPAGRFLPEGHATWAGHWAEPPGDWGSAVEAGALRKEAREVIVAALGGLAPVQRLVVTMRDIEGWASEDVCEALELTPGNQRVLLHRARAKMRASLDAYFAEAARV